jgi:c(7)-type cytochrome triheme protein
MRRAGLSAAVVVLLLAACGPSASEPVPEPSPSAPAVAAPGSQVVDQAQTAAPGTSQDPSAPAVPAKPPSPWAPLTNDFLHDPYNPSLPLLQEPEEALSVLPPAQEGNHVDWVAALRSGAIQPRTNIYPETKIRVIDLDILFEETAGQPMVLFPHRPHTEWLDCENCHDKIFIEKKGANDFGMLDVLEGRYCGQCHGAVSFPLTQCQRCHSVPRSNAKTP